MDSKLGAAQLGSFQLGGPANSPVIPQSYEFKLSQPEIIRFLRALNAPLTFTGPKQQFDGATVQATYIFPPNQPDQARFRALQRNRFIVNAHKWVDHLPAPQSYIFPVSNPVFNYYKPSINRYLWSNIGHIRVQAAGHPDASVIAIFAKQATARPIMPIAYLLRVDRYRSSIRPNTGQESNWQPPLGQ